ncbi:MAG TPA: TOBE domain-containing protein [Thermomicrobiales bacterium]|nr:TOBE domain-containing protein [Thermomicrobiales bacterium]
MLDISARNQLTGKVTRVDIDGVTAEVTVDIGGGQEVTGVITRKSVERLGLREGVTATAIIKATDVMFGTGSSDDKGDEHAAHS